jgi:hypothetical protein
MLTCRGWSIVTVLPLEEVEYRKGNGRSEASVVETVGVIEGGAGGGGEPMKCTGGKKVAWGRRGK